MKKIILYLIAILIIGALILAGVKLRHQRQQELAALPAAQPAPWAVQTAPVRSGRATRGFPALALVKGVNEADVSPRLGGIILMMGPREGTRVKKGELLARIDTKELKDKLASLQAQLAGARADAERKDRDTKRALELLKQHSMSESLADQTQSDARAAREKVNSLIKQISAERTRLDYAVITAPFDGVISARLADPGDLATVGKPIYRLIATQGGRLEVRLPADVLERVRPGSEVLLEHNGETQRLRVARIFPSLDERSLGHLEIDVDRLPFHSAPGTLISARVITDALGDALLIPRDALIGGASPDQGWVLQVDPKSQTVTRVAVKVRLRAHEGIAVSGDLHPGEQLVEGHETTLLKIQPGDRVIVGARGPLK